MKPKAILKTIIVILVIISIGFGLTIYLTLKEYRSWVTVGDKVEKFKTDVFLRRLVADDYLFYKNTRPKEQWQIKQIEINQFLKSQQNLLSDVESQNILRQIDSTVAKSQQIFDQIIDLVENGDKEISTENLSRLTAQLTSKAQETISLAGELSRQVSLRKNHDLNEFILFFSILIFIYAIFLSISFIRIWRSVDLLERIDQMKTEFVSLASHQLRTPLTSIKWYTELLQDAKLDINEEQKSYLEEIDQATQRMVSLVNSFLNVSRLELGTFTIEPKEADLLKVVQVAVNEQEPFFKEKNQKFSFVHPESLPKLLLDEKVTHVVIQNLLSNAYKYTPAGGEITLSLALSEPTKEVMIECKDNGYGIPKSQQGTIFKKLFRADNIKTLGVEGTGLGLYIIKTVVEAANCKISFKSEENKGTTFTIKIPLSGMEGRAGGKSLSKSLE